MNAADRESAGLNTDAGLTSEIGEICRRFEIDQLSVAAKAAVKGALLDTLGCMYAALADGSPMRTMLFPHAGTEQHSSRRRLPTDDRDTAASQRALAYGLAAHAQDFDDYDARSGGHPGAVVVPAMLASVSNDCSGARIIEAIAVGYEVSILLGSYLRYECYQRGLHATGVFGAIAAAATAGKMKSLDGPLYTTAFGLAAAQASGLRVNFGSMGKPLQAGHAAMAGVLAAEMAQAGFTSASDAIGGIAGLVELMVGPVNRDQVVDQLRKGARSDLGTYLSTAGPTLKLYASCGSTHAPLECALRLRERIAPSALQRITRVAIALPHQTLGTLFYHTPQTIDERKFSAEYAVAAALYFGDDNGAIYGADAVVPDVVEDLIRRSSTTGDADLQAIRDRGGLPARVEVDIDGDVLCEVVEYPLGSPQRPAPWESIVAKFVGNSEPTLGGEAAEELVDLIANLEQVTDVSAAFRKVMAKGPI